MGQQILDSIKKDILEYNEYFQKKHIPFPNEIKYFDQNQEPFLFYVKEYVEPFISEQVDQERIKKADIILSNVIVSMSQQTSFEKNSIYFPYLTLFYYTYIMDTIDIFKILMEKILYSTSKILELHANLGLLSRNLIEEFGENDYLIFMNMFLEDNHFKRLYYPESFQYLKPIYDRNSEAFKNVSMFVVIQREEIIEIFGLDSLSFMTQDEVNFLVKHTDIQELKFIKQLYDWEISFEKIKRLDYCPQLLKIICNQYLDRKKLVKNKRIGVNYGRK